MPIAESFVADQPAIVAFEYSRDWNNNTPHSVAEGDALETAATS
jgi:hypothetical protein